jgi:hypothetical protein
MPKVEAGHDKSNIGLPFHGSAPDVGAYEY